MIRRQVLRCGLAAFVATRAGAVARPLAIGVTPGPHAEIVAVVRRAAADRGLALRAEIRDSRRINADVAAGALDVACFQDAVAFADEMRSRRGALVAVAPTVTRPIAVYSRRVATLRALPDGATVGIAHDPAATARALILLHNDGLLTLRDAAGLHATLRDVVDNRRRLRLVALPADRLVAALDRLCCAVIGSDEAGRGGLQPARDSISIEDARTPFTDILAVRRADRDAPWVAALVAAYHSDDVKRFVLARFQDSVRRPW